MREAVALALVGLGSAFVLSGVLGVLRFPDVYTRLQASGKCSTTAVLTVLAACAVLAEGRTLGKLLALGVFLLVTGPVFTHAVARSAYECGIRPVVGPWRAGGEERGR